jgi:uncharacterized protein YjbI with pentapeptide repeats
LRTANLAGADLGNAKLAGANLHHAHYREGSAWSALASLGQQRRKTRWPEGFDPKAAGAIRE